MIFTDAQVEQERIADALETDMLYRYLGKSEGDGVEETEIVCLKHS